MSQHKVDHYEKSRSINSNINNNRIYTSNCYDCLDGEKYVAHVEDIEYKCETRCIFHYDDYMLDFGFTYIQCHSKVFHIENDITLYHVACNVSHPLLGCSDKSQYTIENLIKSNKDETYYVRLESCTLDYDDENEFWQMVEDGNVTDEMKNKVNAALQRTYELNVLSSKLNMEILQHFDLTFNDLSQRCNMIRQCVTYDVEDNYYTFPLFIYVERNHDVYYILDDDKKIQKINIVGFDDEIIYGTCFHDTFKLPHYVIVDDVEYVRIDVRDIYPCENEGIVFFTCGKILCSVDYDNKCCENSVTSEEN